MNEDKLLEELDQDLWIDEPLSKEELEKYSQSAKYTKSLNEKKQTTIRFSVAELAAVKAKAKKLGIGYQNLIQALVHNYVNGKIKLEL